jgi:hypothetical protein
LADPATIAGKGLPGFSYVVEVVAVEVEVEEAVEVLVPGPN